MDKKIFQEISKIRIKAKLKMVKNLPAMFFFTDRKRVKDIFIKIQNLPEDTAIIIREYDLSFADRLDFTQKILKISKQKKLKIFIGKDLKLAKKIKADGIHFSDFDRNIKLSQIPKNMTVSYSCHNQRSVYFAKKIKADLVFYSPIFKTDSHPNQKPTGVLMLRDFIRKNNSPTYALGGIDQNNIRLLGSANVCGIGGISIFN